MTFEEMFKSWTLEQKVEWALGPNICNLSENMRSIIVDLKAENERLKGELKQTEAQDQVVIDCLRKANAKLECLVRLYKKEMNRFKTAFYGLSLKFNLAEFYETKFRNDCEAYRKAKAKLKGTK